jgi:hypothetical protein
LLLGLVLAAPALAAEISATPGCGTLPSGGVLATFKVGAETFRAFITTPAAIADAYTLWRNPRAAKRIPIGRLTCSSVSWNCPWHWHQTPSSVAFAEATVELCDGTPSDVEAHCSSFGAGYYCPWSAIMAELRDCRYLGCPLVPR